MFSLKKNFALDTFQISPWSCLTENVEQLKVLLTLSDNLTGVLVLKEEMRKGLGILQWDSENSGIKQRLLDWILIVRWTWNTQTVQKHYTYSTQTVNIQYTNSKQTEHTHSAHTVHKQYTNSTQTVHKQYKYSSQTLQKQYTNCSQTVHIQFTNIKQTVQKQYANITQIVHKQYIYDLSLDFQTKTASLQIHTRLLYVVFFSPTQMGTHLYFCII